MTYDEQVQKFVLATDIILTRFYKSKDKMHQRAKERECIDEFDRVYDDVADYLLKLRHMYDDSKPWK